MRRGPPDSSQASRTNGPAAGRSSLCRDYSGRMRRSATAAVALALLVLAGCGSHASHRLDAGNAKKLVVAAAPPGVVVAAQATQRHGVLRATAPDGRWQVIAAPGAAVRLVDAHTHAPLDALAVVAHPTALAWTRDSRTFAVGSSSGTVSVWEEFDHKTFDLTGVRAPVTALAFSPDGSLAVSAHADRTVRVWDTDSHKQLASFRLPEVARRLSVSLDAILAGGSRIWELRLPR
jgi:WD40 repeat protein